MAMQSPVFCSMTPNIAIRSKQSFVEAYCLPLLCLQYHETTDVFLLTVAAWQLLPIYRRQCYTGSLNWTVHRVYSKPGFTVWPKVTTYSCPLLYSQISSMPRIRAAHEHSIRRFKTVCLRTRNERDGQTQNRLQCVTEMLHTCCSRVCAARECCILQRNAAGWWGSNCNLSLSLSLSHTHTHTHTVEQRKPMQFIINLHPPHWNPPWPLLHAMQPPQPMDRNHLGQCTALTNKTECERYWEARTKMMENRLCCFIITIFCDYPLALGLYIYPECFIFLFCIFKV